MVKTLLGKFWTQQKSVKLQAFNCSITNKWVHWLVFFYVFAYFFKNIYFKVHFKLTASVCIIVQDWYIEYFISYFMVYIFSLFSCHKISTLAFRSMSVIYHDRSKIGQWSVFTWPIMSVFYPILSEKNWTSFFSIFYQKTQQ